MRREHLLLISYLLVQAYQQLWLVAHSDIYQWFTYVNHIHHPSSRPLWLLVVIIISHELLTILLIEDGGYIVPETSDPSERTH